MTSTYTSMGPHDVGGEEAGPIDTEDHGMTHWEKHANALRMTAVAKKFGTLDELRVIAAAVIGGTALSGGLGTIYGAVLGALIMQALQSGMAMVGVDAPFQNIVVGAVLVLAVLIDILYRKKVGA